MTKLRLVLLATTAVSALPFVSTVSHAQSAPQLTSARSTSPMIVAQAENEKEKEQREHGKQPPRGAPPPPRGAPSPKVAPPEPHSAPKPLPPAAAPPPHAVPPAAAPKAPPPPAAAPPSHPLPPAAAPKAPPPPAAAPPAAARPSQPTPPPPPAAAPPPHPVPPAAAPIQRPAEPRPPAAAQPPVAPKPPSPPNPPSAAQPHGATPPATSVPTSPPAAGSPPAHGQPPAAPPAPGRQGAAQPPGNAAFVRHAPPSVAAPLPPPPRPTQALTPLAPNAAAQGPRRLEDFRSQRHEVQEGGRTVITEPGLVIVRDPSGQAFVRHDEEQRFRYGARDIRTDRFGNDNRTIVVRPDGTQIITIVGSDGRLLRRMRRDRDGREIIIIDNSYRDPAAVGGFYVDLPLPVIRIPRNRYIVDADDAPPDLIYDTLVAPPVDPVARRYSLDEIRYSPGVRMLMPSIDLNTINFDTGSWAIAPDQAAKLQVIADSLNRAISRNPREVFLIEGHTDATGNDVDNLSLSDRRAQATAELLTAQFQVPPENLTTQGYGSQFPKEQTAGPSRINRRVTIRRITPLLDGGR